MVFQPPTEYVHAKLRLSPTHASPDVFDPLFGKEGALTLIDQVVTMLVVNQLVWELRSSMAKQSQWW